MILFIDELDEAIHLELQRKLIGSSRNEMSEKIKLQGNTIHIIYTTHSLFLTLDMQKNQINKIHSENGTIKLLPSNRTFGKSIIDVIKDEFYLSTMFGEETQNFITESFSDKAL